MNSLCVFLNALVIVFNVITTNSGEIIDQSENYRSQDYNGQTGKSHKNEHSGGMAYYLRARVAGGRLVKNLLRMEWPVLVFLDVGILNLT